MFDVLSMLQAILGIGLVIFVHEAGHYMAARWCGVRVLVFSLGFGPAIVGFRHKGTLYQIGAIPVGGFVSMAGDHQDRTGRAPLPDELSSKSVGQRFLVYSGGVLMNLALAAVVFPLLFWHGVSFIKPVAGAPVPGGPAWQAGVAPGSEILEVNGAEVFDGLHVLTEVALGGKQATELLLRDPDSGAEQRVYVEPRYDEGNGINRVDLGFPAADPERRVDVELDSPAWRAGLRDDDRIVRVADLPSEFRLMDQLRIALARSDALELEVESPDGQRRTVTLEPALKEGATRPRLGIQPARVQVIGLRDGGPLGGLDLREDDRLVAIGDRRIVLGGDLELALLEAEPGALLTLDRPLDEEQTEYERIALPVPELSRADVFRIERFLALGPDVQGLVLAIAEGEGAFLGGMRNGDRLLAIDGQPMPDWDAVFDAVQAAAGAGRPLELAVQRSLVGVDAGTEELVLTASAIPQPERERGSRFNEYGFAPRTWDYVFKADGPLHALRVGLNTSWLYVEQTWLTLKGMLLARVSTRNIGGPVAIGQISYSFAERGWAKLLYFLCMLSVNLALINVLPIPLFDGGHLLFLLIEKVKGAPVSERVVGYSQLVGVVFIVGLMVYVTFNDIRRVLGL